MPDPLGFVEPAPRVLRDLISDLKLKCPQCVREMRLESFSGHKCTQRNIDNVEVPGHEVLPYSLVKPTPANPLNNEMVYEHVPSTTVLKIPTAKDILKTPVGVVTPVMKKVGLFILKRLMEQSDDGQTALFPTGGQVCMITQYIFY